MIEGSLPDGMDHVRMLADVIGKRPTGFEGERRAAKYLCDQLNRWGLLDVCTEPFETLSWDYSRCALTAFEVGPLEVEPVQFSGSTPPGGIEAELIVYEGPEDIRYGEVGGKIPLVYGAVPKGDGLLKADAAGLIVITPGRPLAYQYVYGPDRELVDKLPMVNIAHKDGVELVRNNVKRVKLEVQTTVRQVTGSNVVGTIPSRDGRQDGRINVSGHYDSCCCGGCAADNATGAACAMAVLEVLSQDPPPSAVDAVLFSAEEIGLAGAQAYADKHAERLSRTRLGVYFDGQGDILGRHRIHVMGQPSLADFVRSIVTEIDYRCSLLHHATCLDNGPLSALGVPTLWFQRPPQVTWHTRHDVTAEVSPKAMLESIRCATEIVRRTAQAPNAFEPGLPEDQVQQLQERLAVRMLTG